MPLFLEQQPVPGFRLLIWDMSETPLQAQQLEGAAFFKDEQHRHPRRIMQRYITGHLLWRMFAGDIPQITYDKSGKPHMPGALHLSISHSRRYLGLCVHDYLPAGLDLEEPHERIVKLASRFINSGEEQWIRNGNYMHNLYKVWGAKECMFKAEGIEGVDFRKNMHVEEPAGSITTSGRAVIQKGEVHQRYACTYLDFDALLVVYTIAENAVSSMPPEQEL